MKFGLFILLAVIILGGLFSFFSPKPQVVQQEVKNSSVTAAPTKPTAPEKKVSLTLKNGELVSGDTVIALSEGDTVIISVTSDTADELHIHGYDKAVLLKENVPAHITFTADLTGRFPIELHEAEAEIAVLEVHPR